MAVKDLSERDICTKFITPAIVKAGWDVQSQIREEVSFTKGRIIVRGKLVTSQWTTTYLNATYAIHQ
jgi:type I restriction enzyme R subunit